MIKYIRFINYMFINFGINIRKIPEGFKGLLYYIKDYYNFSKKNTSNNFPISVLYPIFGNRFGNAGVMNGHYFHQDYYIAKRIYEQSPTNHLDIGSRIDGFVAHVAVFRKVLLIDVRPIESTIKNIEFIQADLTIDNKNLIDYTDSISCLHAIEHFGLGRYGDPIDPNGHISGFENIYKMLKKGGTFYFSTPIGPQRVEFNAHRVFSLSYLLELFEKKYLIRKFSLVNDKGEFFEEIELTSESIQNNFKCYYGCGIFELEKL